MGKITRVFIHVFIALVFIALGVMGFGALKASKPQINIRRATVPLPVVMTTRIQTGEQPIRVLGEGTVRPLHETNLVPQVGGKLLYVSQSLVNGGEFNKNDVLLRIDPVDYQLAVTLAKAKIRDAESRLELKKEEAAAAQEEWRLLYSDSPDKNRKPPPLVAKEPQLAAARAKLEADRADLKKALLSLERTEIKAPFGGRVGNENVDIGQYVTHGQPLAMLYSIEAAEIVVPLELEDLFWFHVPGFTPGNGPGSPAVVRASIAGRELSWSGEVVRTEGKVDERTRMINVIVRVNKPYAHKPPLIFGLFVRVEIEGRTLPKAAMIPRAALRQGNRVWVVDEVGRLHIRRVEVARIQGDRVIIRSGLKKGEQVVTSSLKAVSDNMAVRAVPVKGSEGS